MERRRIEELVPVYRDGLLEDTLPFWIEHAVDREGGGFRFCLDRDGTVVDTDKGVWQQARFTWLLSTLCERVERRDEWLDLARHGIEFLRERCIDSDGRLWFQLTREGRPLRKRRYFFTECFGAMAFAAWAKAVGDDLAAEEARRLFRLAADGFTTPGRIPPKVEPGTRPQRSIGPPMILLGTAQVLRETIDEPLAQEWIDRALEELRRDFVKPELEAVLEVVGESGEVIDHFDGRTLNPGHAIEAAWFVLEEARIRDGAPDLVELGARMLDWSWARGWDPVHGGLFYFVDLFGGPVQEYWHDMKFWWPHCEAILATLLAHELTGDSRYETWHALVHDWAHSHFADPEHGEWFGYLHRDGTRASTLKGNLWKGPFHLPRMQLACWEVLERMNSPG